MCAIVLWVIGNVGTEQEDITLELIRFAATIILVINVNDLIRNLNRRITAPILMGSTHALPVIAALHKARIVVLNETVGLNNILTV
jgi:hypothetical protein